MKTLRYLILAMVVLGIVVFFTGDEPDPASADQASPISSRANANESQAALPATRSAATTKSAIPESPAKASSSSSLNDLPSSEQQSLWKAFSEARREVRPIPEQRAQRTENLGYDFYALHPKQNLTTRFGDHGVQIVSSDRSYTDHDAKHPTTAWQAQIRLLSFAGENVPQGARPEKSELASSRMEYRHRPGLTEWYDNGVAGMEHGYTIAARPPHLPNGEEVVLEVALGGLKAAQQERDDGTHSLVFMDGERNVLSYSKLVVVDANGNELPATMQPTGAGFTLAYNDAQAVYPVIVDPLIVNEEAKLNRIYAAATDEFGFAVAISGNYVVVGAHEDDDGGTGSGSAFVFARSGSSWNLQAILTADDAAAGDSFGTSVSISGDSVLVGASGDDDGGDSTGSAYVFTRSGTSWSQQEKLTADDAADPVFFGNSVSISGDSAVVGAWLDNAAGPDSGSAYVFTRSGSSWFQQDKLTAVDAAANDFFGISVSISDDSVLVGASGNGDSGSSSGSAYVFTRSGTSWTQQSKLTAIDAATFDRFGFSVSISGDSAVVSAHRDDDGGSNSGSAYVFIRSGSSWTQQAKLKASDAALNDEFGWSVAISGNSVIVGSYREDAGGSNSGSAYIFTRSGSSWTPQTKLTASDGAADDFFGYSVAISGNSVVVGAHQDDDDGIRSGSAYVFNRRIINGLAIWSQHPKLTASDAAADDSLGISVAISGDSVVVGANGDDDRGSASGSAYVFTRSGASWSQQAKLTASDAAAFDNFGFSVAISGDSVVVGADRDDDSGSNSGSAYVFTRSGTSWTQQDKLTAIDAAAGGSFGRSVAISGDSVVVGADGDDEGGSLSGSTYVFTRSGSSWSQQDKLTASDAAALDKFGSAVAISGDSVVVGAHLSGDSDSGSAYIFTRNGSSWSEQAKLMASDPTETALFGFSVAISGDTVVVGSFRGKDGSGVRTGSAYVFIRSGSTWSDQAKLTASDGAAGDDFGASVAISGDSVVVGAVLDDHTVSDDGSAYVFTRSGSAWSEQAKLTASDTAALDEFGISVAISGDSVVVGAIADDDGGSDSGSVYVFRLTVSAERELQFFDHLDVELVNGAAATEFPGQLLDTVSSYTFSIANAGVLDLDIQSVSLGGVDASEFSLNVPDISSPTDLATGENLYFTISSNPTGGTRLRDATLLITSNDTDSPAHSCTISGLGLSRTADADLDGMSDWAEYSLRGYGFDWNTPQPNEVAEYYELAAIAGLYVEAEIAGLNGTAVIVDVDMTTNTASFVIGLEESLDLDAFTSITIDPAKLSVDGDGNIRYEVDAPAGKKFFRAGFKP